MLTKRGGGVFQRPHIQNVDGLLDYVAQHQDQVKLRPDQSLVFRMKSEDAEARLPMFSKCRVSWRISPRPVSLPLGCLLGQFFVRLLEKICQPVTVLSAHQQKFATGQKPEPRHAKVAGGGVIISGL